MYFGIFYSNIRHCFQQFTSRGSNLAKLRNKCICLSYVDKTRSMCRKSKQIKDINPILSIVCNDDISVFGVLRIFLLNFDELDLIANSIEIEFDCNKQN